MELRPGWEHPNLPRPTSRSHPSGIACLQGWKRLEPGASRPPAPRVLVLLVARWLAEHNEKLLGLYFCLLFETYMQPSEGLALRGFQLLPPIKGIRGAAGRLSLLIRASEQGQLGKNRRARHQRVTGLGTPTVHALVHAGDKGNGKRVEVSPLTTTADHAICPPTRRCKRRPRYQLQKLGRSAETRRMEELQHATKTTCSLVLGYVHDPTRTSPARAGTRTRPGTTLEKALTRALVGPTFRVFLSILNAARPVGTILNTHGYAVLFLALPMDQQLT